MLKNVSIGIVALNEEKSVMNLLNDLLEQTYPLNNIELILVDSGSEDKTMTIFEKFSSNYKNLFKNIIISTNKKRTQASGWNVVFGIFSGEMIIRLDAHSRIEKDFVENNVYYQNKGEYVTGGLRSIVNEKDSNWMNTLYLAELSLFGSGISFSRRGTEEKYVKSMFHACYRDEVIKKVGNFNENLGRTEDNEYHYRVAQAGYKLLYSPKIKSYQYIRPTLVKMIKQKYGNGYWIGKTLFICKECLSLYHFVPFFFVLANIFSLLLLPIAPFFLLSLYALYVLFCIVNTVTLITNKKFNITSILLPSIFFILHISYGLGTIKGMIDQKILHK